MASHVALLRGINVGGHNKLTMAELRASLEAAGFEGVRSYIQSGNIVFDVRPTELAGDVATRVAEVVERSSGVSVPVVVRTAKDFLALEAAGHLMADSGVADNLLMVGFCSQAPESPLDLDTEQYLPDRAELVGSEIFLAYPEGSGSSRLTFHVLERRLGVSVTVRNWRTVAKVAAMLDS